MGAGAKSRGKAYSDMRKRWDVVLHSMYSTILHTSYIPYIMHPGVNIIREYTIDRYCTVHIVHNRIIWRGDGGGGGGCRERDASAECLEHRTTMSIEYHAFCCRWNLITHPIR
jgi:hypothetical protein